MRPNRRDNVLRGRFFRKPRRRQPGELPWELQRMVERDRNPWRRYWTLWTGAVAVGLVVGIVPEWLASDPEPVEVVAVPKTPAYVAMEETPSEKDRGWIDRAFSSGNSGIEDGAEATEASGTSGMRASFSFCHTGGGYNCVVDGDTIWLEGQNIRIADIDAPETHEPRCPSEKALGDRATQRLLQLVNGGSVSLEGIGRDEDSYGRKLRLVMIDGASVGDTLVSEGLARWYEGGRRSWC